MARTNTAFAFADPGDNDNDNGIQTEPCPRYALAKNIGYTDQNYLELLAEAEGFPPRRKPAPYTRVNDPERTDASEFFGLSD